MQIFHFKFLRFSRVRIKWVEPVFISTCLYWAMRYFWNSILLYKIYFNTTLVQTLFLILVFKKSQFTEFIIYSTTTEILESFLQCNSMNVLHPWSSSMSPCTTHSRFSASFKCTYIQIWICASKIQPTNQPKPAGHISSSNKRKIRNTKQLKRNCH